MSTGQVELFTSFLALIALVGTVAYVVAARWTVLPSTADRNVSTLRLQWSEAIDGIRHSSLWLAFVVAASATAGSLYFSEVANYVPCQLCWYQRICMYPLTGILFVAALRKDFSARWYCLPILVTGMGISAYHYFIEWKPAFGDGTCSVGPSCTDIWFRRMGFVTLAFMALCGFIAVFALLFTHPRGSRVKTSSSERLD